MIVLLVCKFHLRFYAKEDQGTIFQTAWIRNGSRKVLIIDSQILQAVYVPYKNQLLVQGYTWFASKRHELSHPRQQNVLLTPLFLLSQARPRLQRGGSSASLHNSLMRNSIFQLMIHTLDPLSEGKMDKLHRETPSIMDFTSPSL